MEDRLKRLERIVYKLASESSPYCGSSENREQYEKDVEELSELIAEDS